MSLHLRALSLASLLLAAACSDPCDKLLSKVCDCPGERAQVACREAKARREARDKERPDTAACKAQLETFQCGRLN